MKPFLDEEFLLESATASRLYHRWAEPLPVIDYHCHINPAEIAADRRFTDLAQVWLGGDHYKWRLMRGCGVDERLITGDAPAIDKFRAFARILPLAAGNPMYHWSHLELKRYFHYDGVLNEKTADAVWEQANAELTRGDLSVRGILRRSRVEWLATTDDPADDLAAHRAIAAEHGDGTRVFPAWRPDRYVNIDKPDFAGQIERLAHSAGRTCESWNDLQTILTDRLDYFAEQGCRASDHGLTRVPGMAPTDAEIDAVLRQALAGQTPDPHQTEAYQAGVLHFLAGAYARRDWVMQIHYGCLRNVNSRQFRALGLDTGYDVVAGPSDARSICFFLDRLDRDGALPKTILYSLHPADNEMLVSIAGSFQGPQATGKIQHGSAWWFNDTRSGMIAQLTSLANLSALGTFIGMLTDSRSFLSYTRHEYFRRIFCNLVGDWVERGEYPDDEDALRTLVEGVCYRNASRYFAMPRPHGFSIPVPL